MGIQTYIMKHPANSYQLFHPRRKPLSFRIQLPWIDQKYLFIYKNILYHWKHDSIHNNKNIYHWLASKSYWASLDANSEKDMMSRGRTLQVFVFNTCPHSIWYLTFGLDVRRTFHHVLFTCLHRISVLWTSDLVATSFIHVVRTVTPAWFMRLFSPYHHHMDVLMSELTLTRFLTILSALLSMRFNLASKLSSVNCATKDVHIQISLFYQNNKTTDNFFCGRGVSILMHTYAFLQYLVPKH